MFTQEALKAYVIKDKDRFTYAFETKEDVEDYLCAFNNLIACYNEPYDSWSLSNNTSIIPVDKIFALGLNIGWHKKICNNE